MVTENSAVLPSGTVTFLFADVLEDAGGGSPGGDLTTRRDVLIRAAIEQNGGVVFKAGGDAVRAVFRTSPDGASAALAIQRRIHQSEWGRSGPPGVRIALHAGAADVLDGEYVGPAVHRATRLLAIGNPGQILGSAAIQALLIDVEPRIDLRDLGWHRLRGIATPEHVFQLGAEGLPHDFPPLRSVDAVVTNLPRRPTPLVGRDREVEEILDRVGVGRVVSLVAAGGSGKTRLAIEVGRRALPRYRDGVWLVELGSVQAPDHVATALAAVLQVRERSGRSTLDGVIDYMLGREALIVLDTCEHVLDACARVAEAILRRCPEVHVLATSREPLAIDQEVVYPVPPLGAGEAVRMFVDRARATAPRFAVDDDNAGLVEHLCRRVDGMPFAIELAAARLDTLDIAALAAAIDERFRTLGGGSAVPVARQQILRALIDWSFGLLSAPAKAVYRRLAVFAGGWTSEAAQAVCADDVVQPRAVEHLVAHLVEKGLVVATGGEGGAYRYAFLEPTRADAAERLLEAGERETVRRRHAAYFSTLAEGAAAEWARTATIAWLDRLRPEHDNFRAALQWAIVDARDLTVAGRIAGALQRFWYESGLTTEGRRALETLLEHEDSFDERVRAELWYGIGLVAFQQGDDARCATAVSRALDLYARYDDRSGIARAHGTLASAYENLGRIDRAEEEHRAALAVLRSAGNERGIANTLGNLARLLFVQRRDPSGAQALLDEALVLARRNGVEFLVANVLFTQAEIAWYEGRQQRARATVEESRHLHELLGNGLHGAEGLELLGRVETRSGELLEARMSLEEALLRFRRLRHARGSADALDSLAELALAEGRDEEAVTHLAASERERAEHDVPRFPYLLERRDEIERAVRARLTGPKFEAAWEAAGEAFAR